MTFLVNIFKPICYEVESELKPKLNGFFTGPIVRGYLPQCWVIKTEKETVTFSLDNNGNTSVKTGAGSRPDVTIDIDHEYLSEALATRNQPSFVPKKSDITFHSQKGKTAFNFLRQRFGL